MRKTAVTPLDYFFFSLLPSFHPSDYPSSFAFNSKLVCTPIAFHTQNRVSYSVIVIHAHLKKFLFILDDDQAPFLNAGGVALVHTLSSSQTRRTNLNPIPSPLFIYTVLFAV